MLSDIKNIWRFKDMIFELTHRELRGKYKGSVLGFLWTYINPLAQIIVYAFFFSHILRNGIERFYLYLIVGMFPWNAFTGGVMQGLTSIRGQGDLVKKVYFPRQVLPLVYVTVNFINMLISFIIIYGILLISGWEIRMNLQVWLIPAIIIEYIFTMGLALMLSAVEVYFRDIEHIMSVLLMIWMYLTPLFYNVETVSEELRRFFYLNPMLYIVGMFQQILYYKTVPKASYTIGGMVAAVVSLIIGWIVFDRLEKRFAEEL